VRIRHEALRAIATAVQARPDGGVTALFVGGREDASQAAAELARGLGLRLIRVDLSQVVSKYIGETEKNLDRVFADASGAGVALFFDEADALFGARTDVKDAHDRYANLETAALFERMERYQGLAILATNTRNQIDAAFRRRLRYLVELPG
jgi:SpoVK/Ycf46/Vps4 family AAA+-type ATPase